MIDSSRWYAAFDGAPIAHRAAAPRVTSTLHLEWHVGGVRVHPRPYRTVTAALLNMPDVIRANRSCGVLMFMSRGVLLPWSERGRQ